MPVWIRFSWRCPCPGGAPSSNMWDAYIGFITTNLKSAYTTMSAIKFPCSCGCSPDVFGDTVLHIPSDAGRGLRWNPATHSD